MKHRCLATLVAFLVSSVTVAGQGQHLFILSGQSNMHRLDPNISFTPAVEKEFGKDNVIVVKHASSGQPIRRWYKKWDPAKADKPEQIGTAYDKLMAAVNSKIKGKKIRTITFVWMQGESDAMEETGHLYAASLKGLLTQIRTDLQREDMNVVIGRITGIKPHKKFPQWETVRKAQVEVAEADPHAAWVDTDEMNKKKDKKGKITKGGGVHFSVEGYKIVGARFAEEAIKLVKKSL
ncbi:sialate O-acetylesterase [Verrucomicrobiota bacterium]